MLKYVRMYYVESPLLMKLFYHINRDIRYLHAHLMHFIHLYITLIKLSQFKCDQTDYCKICYSI
jgi:hypothetical protein